MFFVLYNEKPHKNLKNKHPRSKERGIDIKNVLLLRRKQEGYQT